MRFRISGMRGWSSRENGEHLSSPQLINDLLIHIQVKENNMETCITILCDNSISRSGFVGEHGFSCLIERGGEKYLFDTGPGMSLAMNLKKLNMDLQGLDRIFISHGHYDHTGGLLWVAQQAHRTEVVAHPAIFSRHMLTDPARPDQPPRYIGCPASQEELERSGAAFTFIDHTHEVAPGIWFLTGIDRDPEKVPNDQRLVLLEGNRFVPDPIEDDASLLIETDGFPVLILGCAHAGVLNILNHIRETMQIDKLRAILGGTHLMFYGPEDLSRVMDEFEGFSIDRVGVSHCTGFQAAVGLSNRFGHRFSAASAGSVFSF
jgi:7,8-dihydropterin-6-yl-methyl-4-(beta-D-ribofuranosyl)aminobenzene 5'-phosphate synthase